MQMYNQRIISPWQHNTLPPDYMRAGQHDKSALESVLSSIQATCIYINKRSHSFSTDHFESFKCNVESYLFRFRPAIVKELIHNVLHEKLTGISYNQEESTELTKQLSDEIKTKLKGKNALSCRILVTPVYSSQKVSNLFQSGAYMCFASVKS